MILQENLTYYDILDLQTTATAQEVRDAYLRTKATFHRDSVAIYTLISPEEREDMMRRVEEAYQTLSQPDLRRQYDQSFGFSPNTESLLYSQQDTAPPQYLSEENQSRLALGQTGATAQTVVSIDRVPPMENHPNSDALLIPPATDFLPPKSQMTPPPPVILKPNPPPRAASDIEYMSRPYRPFRDVPSTTPPLNSVLTEAIDMEKEWSGPFLKKVREAYKISLEEMSGITKVTKTYLTAIEDENYSKLPAAVYIRGFVTQMAKVLRLPHDKVAVAYLTRYKRSLKTI
jgi:curved DNA-binding protein CbpA